MPYQQALAPSRRHRAGPAGRPDVAGAHCWNFIEARFESGVILTDQEIARFLPATRKSAQYLRNA
jgi:hypothetical protein